VSKVFSYGENIRVVVAKIILLEGRGWAESQLQLAWLLNSSAEGRRKRADLEVCGHVSVMGAPTRERSSKCDPMGQTCVVVLTRDLQRKSRWRVFVQIKRMRGLL